ncbi:adhesion and penetration protein, partial [Haemophilus influenzae HK1212]
LTLTRPSKDGSKAKSEVGTVKLFNPSLNQTAKERVKAAAGYNIYQPRMEYGKNIYLGDQGKGTLTIENNINQGAGGLYFEGDFVVKPSDNNVTWQGAGISVGEESTVEWQVHNPEGDRLS